MNIKNCSRCRKIYQYDGFKICHSCRQDDEGDFQTVKEYLDGHPGANISDVVEDTKVDNKKVIEFLREGRLEIAGGGNIVLECEKCGVSINTGRFCDKCTAGLQQEIGQAMGSSKEKKVPSKTNKEEFRLIDRYEKRR